MKTKHLSTFLILALFAIIITTTAGCYNSSEGDDETLEGEHETDTDPREASDNDVDTMLNWAQSMTWKGINPILTLSRKIYEKGISLSKKAMRAIEARLERNPLLPKWDIRIQPQSCA